jgi:zinc protease
MATEVMEKLMPISGVSEQMPDAELWRSVCQGSVAAFEVIVRRYQSLVCAVAYSVCGDLTLSEDVAQEAFWSAWRQRDSIVEPGRLAAWLCGIARNLGHNSRRRSVAARPTVALDSAASVPAREPGPVDVAVSREEEALLWQALEAIPETYREPLILFYRQQQSVAEVGAALDLTADAVKQRLSRGRGMLQERVAQLVEGALRRSRPGGSFTVAVVAGLATLSAGSKTALAATGASSAAAPLLKAAAAGLAPGLLGAVLGSLGGLVGGWFGSCWAPAQFAPTKAESQHLRQRGRRIFVVSVFFTVLLAIPIYGVSVSLLSMPTYLILLGAWFVALWGYLAVEMLMSARSARQWAVEANGTEPNHTPLRRWIEGYRGRVFRSRASFLGLPLLDVNVADPAPRGRHSQRLVARGWIAIGNDAYGVVFALGGRAYGLIALGGQFAVGLIAVGGIALGAFAVGGVAGGVVAIGGFAVGWQACGGGAVGGDLACGGAAFAEHTALGGVAAAHDYALGGAAWAAQCNNDPAKDAIFDKAMAVAFHGLLASDNRFLILVFSLLLVLCAVALLRTMYRPG